MSQCRSCNSSDFTLNRATGEMTCSICGSANYISSPTSYIDGSFDADEMLNPRKDRDEFMNNSIFSGTKE